MRNDRIQKVIKHMHEKAIDQLLVTSEASLFYLTEHWVHPMERFLALLIRTNGDCIYVANDLFYVSEKVSCPILRYNDRQDAVAVLTEILADKGIIGVEASLRAGFLLKLQESLHNAQIVEASSCVQKVRMIKDAGEIQLLRESSAINDKAIGDLIARIHAGCKEAEISHMAPEIYCGYGAEGYHSCPIVSFGKNAADPHHSADGTVLQQGDCIVIDTGSIYRDYCSDMTRTVFFQNISREMENVYQTVLEAQRYASSIIRPGIPCCEIDRAARRIIEEAGYGSYFNHRVGHNLGLEGHEAPGISEDNPMPVREGMVFSVEPGVYLPGVGGVRIEDLVVVTKDGHESLNHYPKELKILH